MGVFDYIYYRTAFFLKKRINNWHNASITLISLIQTSILTYPAITILKFKNQIQLLSDVAIVGMILFIILSVLNEFRYSGLHIFEVHKKRHEGMSSNSKKLYGIIIIMIIVLVLFYAPILLVMSGAKLQ